MADDISGPIGPLDFPSLQQIRDLLLSEEPLVESATFDDPVNPTELAEFDFVLDSHALAEVPDAVTAELARSIGGMGSSAPRLVMIEQRDTGLFDIARRHIGSGEVSPTVRPLELSVPTPVRDIQVSTPTYSEGTLCYSTFARSAR